jgi:hypothetical protein
MPLKASDLPWWKWLLIAAIAALVSGFTFVALVATSNSPAVKTFPILFPILNENPLLSVIVMLLGTLVAASCTIVGIIRLIKWACEDEGVPAQKCEKAAVIADKGETVGRLENKTRSLEQRLVSLETGSRELNEINENLHELQSRVEQLAETLEPDTDERKEKISSHSFELLDEEGRKRARLETSPDGQPRLALYDENGLSRASLSLTANGYPELFLTNLYASFPRPSEGGSNRCRVVLGFDDEGYPQLVMYDDPDPKVGGLDPSVKLNIWKAEHSKGASLSLHVYGRKGDGWKGIDARVEEPTPDEDA